MAKSKGADADKSTDADSIYFRQLGKNPQISPEEEKVLGKLIGRGRKAEEFLKNYREKYFPLSVRTPVLVRKIRDIKKGVQARKVLVAANLKLAVSFAKQYVGKSPNLTLHDLIQEANTGLAYAAKGFDVAFQTKFSTYATWWMRRQIQWALHGAAKTIRIPIRLVKEMAEYQNACRSLFFQLDREPRIEEIAEYARMPTSQVASIRALTTNVYSLEALISESAEGSLLENLEQGRESPPDADIQSNAEVLEKVMETLEPREREVLSLRFGLKGNDPQTLKKVGEKFGLSRERIRQIEAKALDKLRRKKSWA